jgi:two-component system response regulator FlrC
MDKILVVDDDNELLDSVCETLENSGYLVDNANSAKKALKKIQDTEYSLIISDIQMPDEDGLWLVKNIKSDVPIILMTAYGTIDRAVESMQMGVKDFITKPFKKNTLIRSIEEYKKPVIETGFVAEDESMKKIKNEIHEIADKKVPILLTGESGVGKDVVANHIHANSGRKGEFVAVNCAAIPDGMLESVLFGYEKGSFTGAHKRHEGKFIQSTGGTLFLDEIGEMDIELQAKLLRVLETGFVDTIGCKNETEVDLNVIAATNANLLEKIEEKKFRLDLYYRINIIEIDIPSLKNRPKDLKILANQFMDTFSNEYDKKLTLSPEAMLKLTNYSWIGNIRELRNVIQRACISSSDVISAEDIKIHSKEKTLDEILEEFGGNRRKTAEYLGISVRTLQYKIKQSGLIGK